MNSPIKKKILLIGPAYPYRGGNALFVTKTFEVLRDEFEIRIFNYKLLYPSLLFPGTTQFDKSEKQVFEVPSERIINSISPINWYKVSKRIIQENADLVIFDWWHPFFGPCLGTISMLIKKKYQNNILFIAENIVSHESNKIDRILTRFGLKNASTFLTLSKNVQQELGQFISNKKIFRTELPIYNCYSSDDQKNIQELKKEIGLPEDAQILLFFGYVRKYKGLDILIKSFPKILKKYPNSFLLVVGEFYNNPETYLSLINNSNIGNRVKVINKFVANEDVASYYQVSDVVILPYKSATQSGILNIAYGFNKPVIVTDVGGLAEFVVEGKTGFVVQPNSVDELVNGYENFMGSIKTEDFEQNIIEHNKKNSFNNIPRVIENIIEKD